MKRSAKRRLHDLMSGEYARRKGITIRSVPENVASGDPTRPWMPVTPEQGTMKKSRHVFDSIMRGLKEIRDYREGKLEARTTKVIKVTLSEGDRRYLLRLLEAAHRPNTRLIELLGGIDVRVDWTVWKRRLGKFSPDFMEGKRDQGTQKPRPKS